ncbi:MAG: histidine--tRNA ligase [Candidatus Falkowbacteria bacterium]|nr:histidine--tRNA ligase [Candidatus Falkowbacteria bacterium]
MQKPKEKVKSANSHQSAAKPELVKVPVRRSQKSYSRMLGMKDCSIADSQYFDIARRKAEELCACYGFDHLETPILENIDLYKKSARKANDKEIYPLMGEKNERMCLRPELTQGIVRHYIEQKLDEIEAPHRVFSIGQVFRNEKLQSGSSRQFTQFEIEILKDRKPIAEAMVISLAYHFFKDLGIDILVQINSLGGNDCRKEYGHKLANFYRERGRRSKVCHHCKQNLLKNILSLLDCKEESCVKLREEAPQIADFWSEESRDHFKKVCEYLDELDIPYNFNPFLVRGLNYYNDTVFEFWPVSESGVAQGKYSLAGGGRCDYLVENMGGKPSSAVGLAIGLERTATKMRDRHYPLPGAEDNLVFIAQLSDSAKLKSLQLFDELRQAGFKIRQSFSTDSLKAQMEEAVRSKAKISLIMGKKEVMDETILMRDMDSTVQEIVPIKKIREKLAKKIDLSNNESKLITIIKHI